MNKKNVTTLIVVAIAAILIILFAVFVDIGEGFGQATEHCPDGWVFKYEGAGSGESGGVNFTVDGATVTFDTNVNFCVKAGLGTSGKLVGNIFTVDWENNGGQIPDISYIVIYDILETSTPTMTATLEITETPTPTSTAEVTSTPTPTSELTSTSTPTKEVTNTPEATGEIGTPAVYTPQPTPSDLKAGGSGPNMFFARIMSFIRMIIQNVFGF